MIFNAFWDNHDQSSKDKFVYLYVEYRSLLQYIANRILFDNQLAEDVVQSTYIKIIKNIHKIDDVKSNKTKAFLVVIARNIALKEYHKKKKASEIFSSEFEDLVFESSSSSSIDDIIINREKVEEIMNVIESLPMIYKDTFALKYTYELTNKEIAEYLDISEDLVRKRLQIVRDRVKKIVGDDNKHSRRKNIG